MLAFGPQGDIDKGALWSGQVAIRLKDIPTVKEVIDRVMAEAGERLEGLCSKYA